MARNESPKEESDQSWRNRAVSRSLSSARTRAEKRVQRFLDAAVELIDDKGTIDFTIQEVVDRSKQSLRGFYQYFDGKDELLFALLEETIDQAAADLRTAVEAESDPVERLRAFTLRLREWCEPIESPGTGLAHTRLPISEFSWQLAFKNPDRVGTVNLPISRLALEVIEAAAEAGAINAGNPRHQAVLLQQTVMYSWLMNRVLGKPSMRVSPEETWEFCFKGLGGELKS